MKIAVPVNHNKVERAEIEDKFARAFGFIIYDDQTDKTSFIENPVRDKEKGAGIATAQILLSQKIDKLAIASIGDKACRLLTDSDVKIYQVTGDVRADEVLEQIKENKLDLYNE